MKLKPIHFGAVLAGLLAASQSLRAQSHVPGPTDYDRFSRFITERNIFDPNRYPHRPGYVRPPSFSKPSVRNPAFAFVGAMAYEKGMFAFFDGNKPDYRQALQISGKIANFTVADITLGGVTLVSADTTNYLPVGYLMRQGNDGVWVTNGESEGFADQTGGSTPDQTTGSGGGTAAPASSSAPAPASSDANVSDVLKKLMQLRQQENK